MRTLLLVGNGLAIDRSINSGLDMHPSIPFNWNIPNPDGEGLLIDVLPILNNWVVEIIEETDTRADSPDLFYELVNDFNSRPNPYFLLADENHKGFTETERIHVEFRHYLSIAYSHFYLNTRRSTYRNWAWDQWMEQEVDNLLGVMSLNYDLIIEDLLYDYNLPYYYPTDEREPRMIFHGRRNTGVSPYIPVCKPHGSCNFRNWLHISNTTYPLEKYAAFTKSHLFRLYNKELIEPRGSLPLIVPGESNILYDELIWIQAAHSHFIQRAMIADTLIIIGFSYDKADQNEFGLLFKKLGKVSAIKYIIIADPDPCDTLIADLNQITNNIEIWRNGPE